MKINKSDIVLRNIARDLLCKQVGDNINTIAFYVKKFNSSRGLVQNAIDELIKVKAVEVAKKGALGTCILNIDYSILCKIANWDLIIATAPLPYTTKLQGIATGLYFLFQNSYSKFKIAYMQGAVDRGTAVVEDKYCFAVMSLKSANEIIKKNKELAILLKLNNYTYNSGLTCIAKKEEDLKKQDLIIGVDRNSPDQYFASVSQFSNSVRFKEMHYTMLLESLYIGDVDVVLFNTDVVEKEEIFKELKIRNIFLKKIDLNDDLLNETVACIVYNTKEYGIENYLTSILNKNELEIKQQEVIMNQKFPII